MAAIGAAQEFQRVFTGTTVRSDGGGAPHFSYAKTDRRVIAYYFYLVDDVFGPAFVKVCAYFPYPVKIWLNGHEYAKWAAAKAPILRSRGSTSAPPLAGGWIGGRRDVGHLRLVILAVCCCE